jgi:BrnA antitoxin of type II toxin-antitoxin system
MSGILASVEGFRNCACDTGGLPEVVGSCEVRRLDNDVVEHFQATVDRAGGGSYRTLINDALREYIRGARLETVVGRVVREEVKAVREDLMRSA